MVDDVAILVMLISFYILYFICNNPQGINKITVILFILIWLGGSLCKFLGIPKIIDSDNSILAKIFLTIAYIILFVGRTIFLIQTFKD